MKDKLSVVFLSNFFNHHQKPFSDEMYRYLGDGYTFIETDTMKPEQKKLGWGMEGFPSYVVSREKFFSQRYFFEKLIDQADVVITGSAPVSLTRKRIKENKLTFRYSERPLKRGMELWKYPVRFVRWHRNNPRSKNVYMLCASAYTAGDYSKFGLFKHRCFKWGYFPETKRYNNIDDLLEKKTQNSLVWAARYIDWKHPEIAVEVAKRLRQDGYHFNLYMIGNGELQKKIQKMVYDQELEESVHIMGAMTPEEVRAHMEKAQIHIFTSDRQEGWGAVLNEAMNSACVPVVNRNIGSAPYLIANGKNGFHYQNVDELYEKVKYLLDHKKERESMARLAYSTIINEWNAEVAAERFVQLCYAVKRNETLPFHTGPCSPDRGTDTIMKRLARE